MFKSILSQLIDEAIQDCIDYGEGHTRHEEVGKIVAVEAVWAENETDIEITLAENFVVRLSFTEKGVMK